MQSKTVPATSMSGDRRAQKCLFFPQPTTHKQIDNSRHQPFSCRSQWRTAGSISAHLRVTKLAKLQSMGHKIFGHCGAPVGSSSSSSSSRGRGWRVAMLRGLSPLLRMKSHTSWFGHITLKFRQPRMSHAIATRMSHIWYHADRHEQWKRVT